MEKIFVDTSALYALISIKDEDNTAATSLWERLVTEQKQLVTNNYVIVECFTLIQSRLGMEFARQLHQYIIPFLDIEWMGEEEHFTAMENVFLANRRQLSLVDCSSFETMRRLGLDTVFTFDAHFREQGFNIIP